MAQNNDSENLSGITQRQIIHLIYGLFGIGLLSAGIFGIAILAAVILAYIKRSELIGTVYASHRDWVLKTFWWGLLWLILSCIASFIFIGYITGLIALVWIVYRVAKGWLAHFSGETPLPGL